MNHAPADPEKSTSNATAGWVERGFPLPPRFVFMLAVKGIRLAAACAGIKRQDRDDVAVAEIADDSTCAAVFTQNRFCAAPVTVAREHLEEHGAPRYILINSGNANAGTGSAGIDDARRCCSALAQLGGVSQSAVVPMSTGVIGEPLPVERIVKVLPNAIAGLDADGWPAAARAIMTTDTVPKAASTRFEVDGNAITVTGIAKGAGMIRPNMATMLALIATDAAVESAVLRRCLNEVVAATFNCITVDGDTSTNDACMLVATGRSAVPPVTSDQQSAYKALREAIMNVALRLAQAIVKDGEGATRFITITVEGGRTVQESRCVADAIAHSPLVKTAFFAGDPNWGRILAAIGNAALPDLDIDKVSVFLDDVCVVRNGARDAQYSESQGVDVMRRPEIGLHVMLGRGDEGVRIWTCDLSYDYVRINAEYRT